MMNALPTTSGGTASPPAGLRLYKERLIGLVVNAAALIALGLLPFLWAEVTAVPSPVWTGAALALMLLAAVVTKARHVADQRIALFMAIVLLLYAAGTCFNYAFVTAYHPRRLDLLIQNTSILILAFAFFAFGITSGNRETLLGFVLAYLAVATYTLTSSENFTTAELYKRYETMGIIVAYQQLGDSLVICTLMIMARFRHPVAVYVLAALTIPILFVIPSRSAAVIGSFSLIVACLMVSNLRARMYIVAIALIFAVTARVAIMTNISETLEGTRHSTLLTPDEDHSNEERKKIIGAGLNSIRENPVFGYFGFELDAFQGTGFYIHNVLDIWAQAGFLAFLMFLMYWTFVFRQWFLVSKINRSVSAATFPLLVFAALSWLVSRQPAFAPLYFCLGYACGSFARATREPTSAAL